MKNDSLHQFAKQLHAYRPLGFWDALPMLSPLAPERKIQAHSFQLIGKLFRFDFNLCCD